MSVFYKVDARGDVLIQCRVQPKAGMDRIGGVVGDALKVRITAPPVQGKANKHLLRYLARSLSLRPHQLTLDSGERSKIKTVRVSSLDSQAQMALLQQLKNLSHGKHGEL